MALVSIIVPVYRVEHYIQRCLGSVMAQEDVIIDIECIVVDDCSPDKSIDIIHQMLDNYKGSIKFVLLRHECNRGLSAARNTGLINARGDYVFFLDSDDYLMPNCFQYFLTNLCVYPDADVVAGNVLNCKGGNSLIHHIQEPWYLNDCNVFFPLMLRHQIYLYAWNKMIRRELLIDNHIFFEEGILYEDQCWSYELFSKISSILLLPQVTYVYEFNPNSIVNTTFTVGNANKVIWSYTVSMNKILDNPPSPFKYEKNIMVDYLLYVTNFLMNGVDVLSRFDVSKKNVRAFRLLRLRLLSRSLGYGRLLLSCFFMILFPPLYYLQRFAAFRHHYYDIEMIINRISHLTDFLHRKNRI